MTLIELLVAVPVMITVVTGGLSLYGVAAREQDRIGATTRGLIEDRNAVERMTRELRQALTVCAPYPACGGSFAGAASIDFERCHASAGSCDRIWVRYDCSGLAPGGATRRCIRSQSSSPTALGGGGQLLLDGLATTPPSSFGFTAPNYVTIAMRVAVKGRNNPISLGDGVRARNVNETIESGEVGS